MELFSIRIQRTFQLVSTVLTGKIVKFGLVRQILTRFQPQVLNLSN